MWKTGHSFIKTTPEIRINCPDKEKFFVVKELEKNNKSSKKFPRR